MDVEIVLQIERFEELPRILVQHQPRDKVCCLKLASFVASLEVCLVCEPRDGTAEPSLLHDVLEDRLAREGVVQVVWFECGTRLAEVLRVVHPIVFLVLVSVQIRDSPMRLVLHEGFVSVSSLL